jgi:hypothetical protein
MTASHRAPTIDTVGRQPAEGDRRVPDGTHRSRHRVREDLRQSETATDKLKAANLRNKDQLETDVARARDKAAATADQFKHKADGAHDQASSQWQEIRGKWQAYVTKVRTNVKNKQARFEADTLSS